jgi:hypothetical protein
VRQEFGEDEQQLRARILKLERRVQLLLGIVRLVIVPVRLFGFRLDSQRVPTGEAKSTILGAIDRAKKRIPVTVTLRVLGLSASRYDARLRLDPSCSLDDRSSCLPSQLTHQEVATLRDMVTAMEFRHMPIARSPCTRSASAGCSRPRPHGADSSVNEAGAAYPKLAAAVPASELGARDNVSTRPSRRRASAPPSPASCSISMSRSSS